MEKMIPIINCKYDLKYNYFVTDTGKVYSEFTKRFLSIQLDKNGYEKVQMMSKDNKRHRYSVHRLVLENFKPVENMNELQVNHIDGNKRNNNLSNLEWVSCQENIDHAINIGLRDYKGEKNPSAILTDDQVIDIINKLLKQEQTIQSIADEYKVSKGAIERIKYGKSYKHLTINIFS